ncbi:MAG TPA: DinB family protein [Longilinea sp.]|nr:DinB family protein [Longilinea sp.]
MTPLTLLLDLDDTLISNDINAFQYAYVKALGKKLSPFVDTPKMAAELIRAIDGMIAKNTARLTLEQAFDDDFYPAIGVSKEEVRNAIDEFYIEIFPTLQPLTSPRPQAISLVEEAFKRGWQVVVATNPLFPRTAIIQRLEWAGLSPQKYPFSLITDYEGFHFCKPNPAYFSEILATIGYPDQPAVMVGDTPIMDLVPAAQLGIPGYWVNQPADSSYEGAHTLSACGDLEGVIPWIDSIYTRLEKPGYTTPVQLSAHLAVVPASFQTYTSALDPAAWQRKPTESEWSPVEITAHLRDVDREVYLPRLKRILENDNPFLPGEDTDRWAELRQYNTLDGCSTLQGFFAARQTLIDLISNLPAEAWDRPARHAIFGPTTLAEMVTFITTHDRAHVQQLNSAISAS